VVRHGERYHGLLHSGSDVLAGLVEIVHLCREEKDLVGFEEG
jgi:hypothetical protein